jgi:hypothetical protein
MVLVALLATAGACRRDRAQPRDCHAIFERLVELELEERGYRDPVALARAKERLGRELAARIASCEGRALPPNALACVRQARRAEEITHVCLE